MVRISYGMNLILIVVLIGILGSKSGRATAAVGLNDNAESDAKQVSDTFYRYMQAYEKKDMETLTRSFASDEKLTAFWPDPSNPFRVEGWKEMRKGLEGYLPAIASMAINIRQPIVQVYGPLAIVSCHWSFSGVVGGKPQVGSGRGSYVFEKRDAAWVMVHLHESAMPTAGR